MSIKARDLKQAKAEPRAVRFPVDIDAKLVDELIERNKTDNISMSQLIIEKVSNALRQAGSMARCFSF